MNKEIKYKITKETDFDKPSLERPHPIETEGSGKGIQKIWRFKNDYGASVVKFSIKSMMGRGFIGGSYGAEEGFWELAVLKFNEDNFQIDYKTGITDDVLGRLTEEEVVDYLKKIKDIDEKDIQNK